MRPIEIAANLWYEKGKFMRISALARFFLLFLAFASPTLLRAQFQRPTPEELKMTADPKAPGAAAVFLNVEEVTDDPTPLPQLLCPHQSARRRRARSWPPSRFLTAWRLQDHRHKGPHNPLRRNRHSARWQAGRPVGLQDVDLEMAIIRSSTAWSSPCPASKLAASSNTATISATTTTLFLSVLGDSAPLLRP